MENENNDILNSAKYSDYEFFNFDGVTTFAKCVKIYDGDTITVVFIYNNKPYKFHVRLADIDTAELKSTNPKEVNAAIQAREKLAELIGDRLVYLECHKFDKYGRILADVYDSSSKNVHFNQKLLDCGLAYKYNGNKKVEFEKWNKNSS